MIEKIEQPLETKEDATAPNRLSMLTYNIHKGYSITNNRFILHLIRNAVEEIHPDLVFLQEIQGQYRLQQCDSVHRTDEPQFEFLADRLWPHYAYGKNAIYNIGHHGNAILSKYPFSDYENINVALSRFASRSILHGIISEPFSTPLHVICIHLGLFEIEREQQLMTLAKRIETCVPAHEPVIIAGDFNDWRGRAARYLNFDEVFKHLEGRYAKTYPVWRPALRMDRIYFKDIIPIKCERFSGRPWRRLSDHTPLYAEFAWPT